MARMKREGREPSVKEGGRTRGVWAVQLITWLPAEGCHLVEMISSVNSVLPIASSWPWFG